MRRTLIVALFVALVSTIAGHYAALVFVPKPTFNGTVRIAFASSLTGPGQAGALEMLRAVELYVGDVNRSGGINGQKVEIVPFDDANSPDAARAVAEKIAADASIIAVIGHNYSAPSLAAAPVYARAGVPAVTPASTHPDVTRNNRWYFRSIFSDTSQGEFLAHYAVDALGVKSVAVISSDDLYAGQIAASFTDAATRAGLEVKARFKVVPKDPGFAASLDAVIAGLRPLPKDALILMAAHIGPSVTMVSRLRDAGITNRILGPDALGSTAFAHAFAELPKEQAQPGFYTDGLYVSVPFLTDTGNAEARRLIERLESESGPLMTWGAPFAYDAAKLIVTAARRAGLKPGGPVGTDARTLVRDQLDAMHSQVNALTGATGTLQFGTDNTPSKPLVIGQFSGRLISSLVQLTFGTEGEGDNARITLHRTPVVYTGLLPERIDALDLAAGTVRLSFDLWFRFQGAPPVADILFANAVDPIILGQPAESVSVNGIEYRLYKVTGRFKINFDDGRATPGGLIAGVEFTHRTLSRDQLIYVVDPAGSTPEMQAMTKALLKGGEWRISRDNAIADIVDRPTKGNPLQSRAGLESRPFSHFVYRLELTPRDPSLRRQFTGETALWACVASTLALIAALLLDGGGPGRSRRRLKLVLVVAMAALFLITSESAVFDSVSGVGLDWAETPIIAFYDLLWWLVPAVLAHLAISRFLWEPLEKKSKRVIPRVIKTFVAAPVYFVAFFGIFANVFERDVTSLIATSGVLAMVIGLALQSNLSNIISGIVINIARPFRPGDWVRIGDAPMAKVLDISWRAVKVQTFANSVISIPNSLAASSRIENCSYPNNRYFIFQTLYFDARHDPVRLTALLYDGLRLTDSVDGRRRLDLMWVKFNGVTDLGLKFLVAFDVYDRSLMNSQEHAAFTSIARVLRHAGIGLGGQTEANIQRLMLRSRPGIGADADGSGEVLPCEALLAATDGFSTLDEAARQCLTGAMTRRRLAPGDYLIRRGDSSVGAALFLIAEGVLTVSAANKSGEHEVGRFGPGDCVGEAALFAETQPNTVSAVSVATVWELPASVVQEVADHHPALSERLAQIHQGRQAQFHALAIDREEPPVDDHDQDRSSWFGGLKKMLRRSFA